jgi:hypothetical protein
MTEKDGEQKKNPEKLPAILVEAKRLFPRVSEKVLTRLAEKEGWGPEEFSAAKDVVLYRRKREDDMLFHVAKILKVVKTPEAVIEIAEYFISFPQFSQRALARLWALSTTGEKHLHEYEANFLHEFLLVLTEAIDEFFSNEKTEAHHFHAMVLHTLVDYADREGLTTEEIYHMLKNSCDNLFTDCGLEE